MDIEIKQIFGKRVKELRNKLNLSQKDFAAAIDLAASYLSEIESGKIKPGFDFFYKITKEYRVNPFYLLHGEEPVFIEPDKEKSVKNKEDISRALAAYFGDNYPYLRDMLIYLKHSSMVRYSLMEHFTGYRLSKKEMIAEELKEQGFRLDGAAIKEIKRQED
jgi:transcriptional regulator with XRE-family HTH domain